MKKLAAFLCAAVLSAPTFAASPSESAQLYQQHCAVCHGADRLGISGPALLPESLARLRKPEAMRTVTDGRVATQMLGFLDRYAKAMTQVKAAFKCTNF